MRKLLGIAASRGIAVGPAAQLRRTELVCQRTTVDDPAAEKARFANARAVAREELEAVYAKAAAETGAGQADIFLAHAMMLEDPEFLEAVETAIETEAMNAESACLEAAERYSLMLEALDDEYFRARAADVRDVAARLLRVMLGVNETPLVELTEPSIILAHDLAPSDTAMLDKSVILGFCTAEGGAMSHTAILARGLGLPAVVGAGSEVLDVPDGVRLVLDGGAGEVLVEPDETTLRLSRERQAADAGLRAHARGRCLEPAITRDGRQVKVVANVGSVAEARQALAAGAEGVGLLRTEFLFLERTQLPDEEEQYQAYRQIVEPFEDRPVVLRTLDVGGDKDLPYLNLPREMNPFLGLRAIRLSLQRPDLFRPQLRAALRSGEGRDLKLMFPMVTTAAEVQEARAVLEACREELLAEGHRVPARTEIGIMIEVPAAAVMADHLANAVDFFSIGTNDLSQYTLAADRTNAAVAPLVSAFHPAVLRLVRDVIVSAHRKGIWVGLCGELAGDPLAIPILLGLGLDEFSMVSAAIPLAKQTIRALDLDQAQQVARAALEQDDAAAVQALVRKLVPAAAVW